MQRVKPCAYVCFMMLDVTYTLTLKWFKIIYKEVQKKKKKKENWEKEINIGRVEIGAGKEIRKEDALECSDKK